MMDRDLPLIAYRTVYFKMIAMQLQAKKTEEEIKNATKRNV
jgi:hypothetical protein